MNQSDLWFEPIIFLQVILSLRVSSELHSMSRYMLFVKIFQFYTSIKHQVSDEGVSDRFELQFIVML